MNESLKIFKAKNCNGLHCEVIVKQISYDFEWGAITVELCHENGDYTTYRNGIVRFTNESIKRHLEGLDFSQTEFIRNIHSGKL
tara:strand:- start:635 stop:886 length:252 start_codon:yes stop_codon:yes gene_type:complete